MATTEFFDDMQVFIDFVTDVIPTGEAGSRTHAFTFKKGINGLPIVYNITSPEQGMDDENWKYVRNTPSGRPSSRLQRLSRSECK